ncbi:hypothetical protein U1Q18_036302 [Sarracenia purpurea var. burkii]
MDSRFLTLSSCFFWPSTCTRLDYLYYTASVYISCFSGRGLWHAQRERSHGFAECLRQDSFLSSCGEDS